MCKLFIVNLTPPADTKEAIHSAQRQ
ncbi:conserved protein of unknown function [Ectopseudomonas oleovorans]|uniref:Uncharacterized protein n=1 Tax=Ectopseudomonas oleovorans TaxID=301 RepID=A0A653B4R6_ECTOL|nr:conserved protein of unknown function [Pseudomonas oleovorans]